MQHKTMCFSYLSCKITLFMFGSSVWNCILVSDSHFDIAQLARVIVPSNSCMVMDFIHHGFALLCH